MDNNRFIEIKEHLTESLSMQLEQIRRFLNSGSASVMIGAGFSKNAIQPDFVHMKDWNALAHDFFYRLYNREPKAQELEFKTPLRLASQVEASFGRNELDQLILDSLPDEVIAPSKLHIDLLKLNWKDVFTTNYDTLLERASRFSDRPYSFVTTKETLLYERQPRIIKLHGSFKDIRPFVITEEDFRTYADKNPAFVNTVRQALIETLFCLIGFSGDDPNFLSWIGWLRDVMDKSIAPIYVIDFRNNVHESEIRLMGERGIKIINMHDFYGVSTFQEGLDFLFQYLSQKKTQWDFYVETPIIKTTDNLHDYIASLRFKRESYPGWLFVPTNILDDYDNRPTKIQLKEIKKITNLETKQWLELLYELNWRMDIFLDPKIDTDLIVYLEEIIIDKPDYDWQDKEYAIDLKLALLRYYRENRKDEDFNCLKEELYSNLDSFNSTQRRLFYYNLCLMDFSIMNYSDVNLIINKWHTNLEDYIGCLWKSMVLMVVDRKTEAINLLNESLQKLRTTMLSRSYEICRLGSIKTAMEDLIYLFQRKTNPIPIHERYMESYIVIQGFKQKYLDKRGEDFITKRHLFGISSETTTWNFTVGYYAKFINSYRYFRLQEITGTPLGVSDFNLNKDDENLFIGAIKQYIPLYALGLIIRSNNEDIQKSCLDREFISSFSREESNLLFDYYIDFVEKYDQFTLVAQKSRCTTILIPYLSKLCTKVSQDRILRMVEIFKKLYVCETVDFDHKLYDIIISSLTIDNLKIVQKNILELPLRTNWLSSGSYYTKDYALKTMECTDKMLEVLDNYLQEQENLNERNLKNVYSRILELRCMNLSELQNQKLDNITVTWRNVSDDYLNVRYTFTKTPYKEGDVNNPFDLLMKDYDTLINFDFNEIHSSAVFDEYAKLMNAISLNTSALTVKQIEEILDIFIQFADKHADVLYKDDSKEMFVGYRKSACKLWQSVKNFLLQIDVSILPVNLIEKLYLRIKNYGTVGFPHLEIRALLLRFCKIDTVKEIKDDIECQIVSIQKPLLCWDAFRALVILNEQHHSIQIIVGKIISLIEFSRSERITISINQLYFLVIKDIPLSQTTRNHLEKLLVNLSNSIPLYKVSEEEKTDLYFYSMKLAAAIEEKYGSSEGTSIWKSLINDEKTFNDVKMGFQIGIEECKNGL